MQIRIPQEGAEQVTRLAQLIATEPFHKRSWAELGFFLASSALAVPAAFGLGVVGFVGVVLTVVFVGVVVLAGGLRAARGLGRWQRAMARRLLGEVIPNRSRSAPGPGSSAGCGLRSETGPPGGRLVISWPRSHSQCSVCGSH